jgi:hypothetical protein
MFLTDGFKLGQNVILECNQIAINSGIDPAFHDLLRLLLVVDVVGWCDYHDIFKSIFKNITQLRSVRSWRRQ